MLTVHDSMSALLEAAKGCSTFLLHLCLSELLILCLKLRVRFAQDHEKTISGMGRVDCCLQDLQHDWWNLLPSPGQVFKARLTLSADSNAQELTVVGNHLAATGCPYSQKTHGTICRTVPSVVCLLVSQVIVKSR